MSEEPITQPWEAGRVIGPWGFILFASFEEIAKTACPGSLHSQLQIRILWELFEHGPNLRDSDSESLGWDPDLHNLLKSIPLGVPVKSPSHVWLFARLLYPGNSPGKNTGVSAVSSSRGSSSLGDRIHISYVSCIGRQVLYHQCYLWIPVYATNLRTIDLNWIEVEKWGW